MNPTKAQVDELEDFLRQLHGGDFDRLDREASAMADFLGHLKDFALVDSGAPRRHVGQVIVDGVLQQGKDYEAAVRPAVDRIAGNAAAETLSGFIGLLQQKRPLKDLLGNFKKEGTRGDLLAVAQYFQAGPGGVNTFDELAKWLKQEANRDAFRNVGQIGPMFKGGDKTADYFRKLVGHWDAIAVDKGQRRLLAKAKLMAYSSSRPYKEKRTIMQLTALHMGCRPIDLDTSIYVYYVATNKMSETSAAIDHRDSQAVKFCHQCGTHLAASDNFCRSCGARQH